MKSFFGINISGTCGLSGCEAAKVDAFATDCDPGKIRWLLCRLGDVDASRARCVVPSCANVLIVDDAAQAFPKIRNSVVASAQVDVVKFSGGPIAIVNGPCNPMAQEKTAINPNDPMRIVFGALLLAACRLANKVHAKFAAFHFPCQFSGKFIVGDERAQPINVHGLQFYLRS